MDSEVDIKDYLMENDGEFKRLAIQHQEYEDKLGRLVSKSFLSEQEKLEEVVLKKKKLALKDQMQSIIYRHQHAQQASGK